MAAFSRRLPLGVALVAAAFLGAVGGCEGAAGHEEPAQPAGSARPADPDRVRSPVDPGDEGQSRSLLQHYIARDGTPDPLVIPRGPDLELEAASWELPFKSKRMVAALMAVAARDELDDLHPILSPDATWGDPDARRPKERPIFGEDEGVAFLAAFRAAATRFDEHATYRNATNFMMGIQEHLRSGAEPMWSYYENGYDRILFRFIMRRGEARMTYIGLYRDGMVPTQPPRLDAMGPPALMSPPVRKEGGEISFGAPKQMPTRQRPRGTPQ